MIIMNCNFRPVNSGEVMNILNIVGAKIWGGAEQYVYDIDEELLSRHIETVVLVDETNTEMQKKYSHVAEVWTADLYRCKGFMSLKAVAKKAKERCIDTIQCHSGKYILFCIALKKMTGARLIFYKHNPVPAKHDLYHSWVQKHVDDFICVSEFVRNLLLDERTPYPEKYHLVYNGINLRRFKLENIKREAGNDCFTVGFAARLKKVKGLYVLLDAVRKMHDDYPEIKLVIAGAGTPEQITKLRSVIKEYNMNSYVTYIGFQDDMMRFYSRIDCLVLPSIMLEAFGLVICEAMYCEVPVITSNTGAQPEIIEHKKTGYLLPEVTPGAIETAILYMYDHKNELPAMGKRGRECVLERFTLKRVCDQILTVLE